jgi:hypothetical protein
MLQNPEAQTHMEEIHQLATNEGYLYEVVYTERTEP